MKKRSMVLMSLILSMVMVSTAFSAEAGDDTSEMWPGPEDAPEIFTYGVYNYSINDDLTITITEYTGDEEVVEIPEEINGHRVSTIGANAFSYKEMKSLSVPEGISRLQGSAFEYCSVTDTIQLPEKITIGTDAFSYGELPSEVTIPAGAIVEPCAFSYCDTLETVLIGPDAVIGSRGFSYCDYLSQVVCAQGSCLESSAFEYCKMLGKVVLCGNVERAEDAFSYCGTIEMVEAKAEDYDSQPIPDLNSFLTGGLGGGTNAGMSGGWEMTSDAAVTDEARAVFDRAMANISFDEYVDYTPAALLATQVVAGTNYCFLCRVVVPDQTTCYQLVYIWQDLEGNAQFLEAQDIEIGLSGESADAGTEPPTTEENPTTTEGPTITVGQAGTQDPAAGEHSITVTSKKGVIVDCPDSAKAGELVTVSTADAADGEVYVHVNGSDIGTWEDSYTYTFIMPDEDVELYGGVDTTGYPGA